MSGRNIGNHYFGVATDTSYRELDIAAGGPVVLQVSEVFDRFWKGQWALPISALMDRAYTEADLRQARATLRDRIAADSYPYPIDRDVSELKATLRAEIDGFVWAPGRIVWEYPAEIAAAGRTRRMLGALHGRVGTLETDSAPKA